MIKIVDYISNDLKQPELSKEYYNLFINEINGLNMFPKRNPIVGGKIPNNTERRKLLVKNYIVFYIINDVENTVYIETIVYGASNWLKDL